MKTSTGLECEHEDQLIPGMCPVCDAWGQTHGECYDCSAELDDEDADKPAIFEGTDNRRRCEDCHESFEAGARRERAREDAEGRADYLYDLWKDEQLERTRS